METTTATVATAASAAKPEATPAAATTPAAKVPVTLADYTERAITSMIAEPKPAAEPAPAAPTPGQEPSPATEPPAAEPTQEPPKTEPAADELEEPEVPEAEQAAWSDGEKRIYGALKKEREARKAAKAELKAEKAEREKLAAKVEELSKPKTEADKPPSAAATEIPGQPLAHTKSFEEVDAQVAEANRVELLTHDLQQQLGQDRAAVIATLTAEGVKEINGKPVAEADDRELGDFLSNAYKGARQTQNAAQPRKVYLSQQLASAQEAVKLIPALNDVKSPEHKRFAAIIAANPAFRAAGPNWPKTVAIYMLGERAVPKPGAAAPAPKTETPPPKVEPKKPVIVPPVPTRQNPGAPGKSAAAIPSPSETEKARAKIHGKGASLADVQAMAKNALTGVM
jgi:hypothetical protein